jgi:hypothetical protein
VIVVAYSISPEERKKKAIHATNGRCHTCPPSGASLLIDISQGLDAVHQIAASDIRDRIRKLVALERFGCRSCVCVCYIVSPSIPLPQAYHTTPVLFLAVKLDRECAE